MGRYRAPHVRDCFENRSLVRQPHRAICRRASSTKIATVFVSRFFRAREMRCRASYTRTVTGFITRYAHDNFYTSFPNRRGTGRFFRFSASYAGRLPTVPAYVFAWRLRRRLCARHLRSSAWKRPAALLPKRRLQKTPLRNAERSYRESPSVSALRLRRAKAVCAL